MSFALPFLTDTEVLEIVKPLRQPAAIMRWFKCQGFSVRIKPNGMPLVLRAHFETATDPVHTAEVNLPDTAQQPDVAALLERFAKQRERKRWAVSES